MRGAGQEARRTCPVERGRTENAVATIQGRGQIQDIELAADENGRLTAVRVRLLCDMGAYLQLVTPGIPLLGAFLYGRVRPPGCVRLQPHVGVHQHDADGRLSRGWAPGGHLRHRAGQHAAAKMGLDPMELRRRNFVKSEQFPYTAFSGLVYDSGRPPGRSRQGGRAGRLRRGPGPPADAERARLDQASRHRHLELLRVHAGWRRPGCWRRSTTAPAATATVRVLLTNKVQVVTGSALHGQGHETCWSMIAAEKLGIPLEDIDVLHSDTAISPIGLDSYGSRSLAVGGVAIDMACDRVIDKARTIAAHQLECAEEDLDFAGGSFTVRGTPDKSTPLAAIALAAFTAHDLPDGMEPNLEASVTYDPPNFSWPFGTHICVVEVDTETGGVDVLKYVAVDDCGVQINPLIVNGQVHGGVVQGLAQACSRRPSTTATATSRRAR